ncbi:hypothetical protein KKD52_04405 [Myxococcota bacterium]|nr:hypothetical protein [Myxococcota bacterium]MBU1413772.1 hypothetical protein [Myxococcota bacterium]MBU1509585.1 hypothetical protein [Myxococcota bacterium]
MRRSLLPLVLIVSLFWLTGCPSKNPTPTLTYPVAKMTRTNTVQINFLTFSQGKTDGNIHPTTIQISPNSDRTLNVGIAQDLSGGLGGQWQAAVWIAAFQAAQAVGRDLSEYAIMVRGQGYIDGPSAGALFTAGIMAAMTGVPVRSDVTMTGTVNPDGTVGPVGGIPNKFRAAVKAGKKILGYPVGQRYSTDLASQKVVDLQEFAKENGVQAVEMYTIFDSYRLLTGMDVPRPEPLAAADMVMPEPTMKFLKERSQKWSERYESFSKRFYDEKLQDLYDSAKKLEVARLYFQTASDLIKGGNFPTAYDYAQRAGGNAFTAYAYGRFVALVMQQRFRDLLNEVSSMFTPVGTSLDQMFEISKKFKPKTVGELNSFISALEQSVSALGYTQDAAKSADAARNLMDNAMALMAKNVPINQIKTEIINQLLNSSLRYGIALLKLEKAKDFMELKDGNNVPLTINPERLEEVAKTYIAVAQANLNYIDQIFIPDFARSAQTDEDSIRSRLMRNNNHYLVAITSLRFPQTIMKEKWGEKAPETFFAQIAGSMGSYYSSSMFLMHHYSLGVRKEQGGVESVKMEKALVNMLEHAEKNVRIYAAMVQKTLGTVPVPARFFYSVGMTMKSGDTALKVKALEMFWRASMQCQLTLQLAKK